jgi:multiple sugar transport system permease protein
MNNTLRHSPRLRDIRVAPYYFLLPFTVLFLVFTIAPVVYDFGLSLFTNTLVGGTHFAWLANYSSVLQSGVFWGSVLRVAEYGVGVMAVTLTCSVTFAVLLDFEYVKFVRAFKLIFFLPYAVPGAIAVMIWGFLLEPQLGTYPLLARDAGFGSVNFLGTHLVLFSIGSISVWALTGFNMLVIYTALRGVPLENIEAAIVDGASKWQIATKVKLPQIRAVVMGMGFLGVLGALQLFTEPSILSVLTDSISTQYTPAMLVDSTISTQSNNNYAAAMAFVLAVISLIFAGGLLGIFIHRRGGFESNARRPA